MKIFIAIMLASSSLSFAKVTHDKSLSQKPSKRTVSQVNHLGLAQERFDLFLKCENQLDKRSKEPKRERECIQNQFYDEQSPVMLRSYMEWLLTEVAVSSLYECEGKLHEISQSLRESPKDITYCLKIRTAEGLAEGFIYFRIKDESVKILKLKF